LRNASVYYKTFLLLSLCFQTSNFKDCTSSLAGSADILQKHSINSLLERDEILHRNGLQSPVEGKFFVDDDDNDEVEVEKGRRKASNAIF